MSSLAEDEKTANKINVDKMYFRVVSKHPQYSNEAFDKKKKDMRSSLYNIFKKYK